MNRQEFVFEEEREGALGQAITHLLPMRDQRVLAVTADHNFLVYELRTKRKVGGRTVPLLVKQRQFAGFNDEIIDVKYLDDSRVLLASNCEILKVLSKPRQEEGELEEMRPADEC